MTSADVPSIKSAGFHFPVHLFRQVLVAIASGFLGFTGGVALGYSSVLLPQLKNDSNFVYDAAYDSWIASITPLSMALGGTCAGPIIDKYGRKFGLIGLVPTFVLGWLVLALGRNVTYLLAGRFITGVCAGAYRPMALVFLGELTDPKHRAMTLISTSLSTNTGALGGHLIGTYIHWRTACLIFCVPVVLAFLLLLLSKESPLWLISKGEICKGIEIYKWYRAESATADEELEKVVTRQENVDKRNIKEILSIVFSKPFLRALTICVVLFTAAQFCGVNTINFYAIDILQNTFSENVDAFLIMIVIDVVRICSTFAVFICVKYIRRRILFLMCSFGTTVVLLGLGLYLYLNPLTYVWVGVTIMIVFIILSNTIVCTAWSFTSEIYPNSVRGLGSAITTMVSFILLFIVVKITPEIMEDFGMAILYTGSAVITLICSVILCFILPETNGISLQQIEDNLNINTSIDNKVNSKV